jgi:hypothetical protein
MKFSLFTASIGEDKGYHCMLTVEDYRTRIGQCKYHPKQIRPLLTLLDRTDLDLLLSHQQYAWIPVWDDHGMLL